mgnify:CR=1 FL=1
MTAATPRHAATIFTGRFGSGKSETAINYALGLARGNPLVAAQSDAVQPGHRNHSTGKTGMESADVILVDLDIITPYFRSREAREAMLEEGVEVIAPSEVGMHLHTPAITPQILGAVQQVERPTVLDAGGDRQGARSLGQYSAAIQQRGYTMHFVVNPFRPYTGTLDGLAASIAEIETSARLEVTSLVSNPNLMRETVIEDIVEGHARTVGFSQQLGLPVAFVCVERRWMGKLDGQQVGQRILPLDRFFVHSWEDRPETGH